MMNFLADEVPANLKEMQIILIAGLKKEIDKQVLTLDQIIFRMRASGMQDEFIKETLLKDLREGGQIFGDFRAALKSQVRLGIEDSARGQLKEEFKDIENWDWLGIADGKICPDCLQRHNSESKTYQEWQAIGLPGTGATVCQVDCRCTLVPAKSVDKPEGGIVR